MEVDPSVTLEQLDRDPHPVLARLRAERPVAWVPALDGWLVTSYQLALEVMRDPERFTVDDPRFSTAQVIGPSMLSLDDAEHARHRAPFVGTGCPATVRERFAAAIAEEAARLIDGLEPLGGGELRRGFAGPLATSTVTRALGLARDDVEKVRSWYEAIVGGVTEITAGQPVPAAARKAFASLRARLLETGADGELVPDLAVLLFGGIETTEGMISNALLYLLENPTALARVRARSELLDAAIEESLRLEPAAAVIDRYATADAMLGGASIARGDLVRISISAANRDPAVFANPDAFELERRDARRHLAFAQGPHVCVGVHLARLEARIAIAALLERFPQLRLDAARPSTVRGLVFRKPQELNAVWTAFASAM